MAQRAGHRRSRASSAAAQPNDIAVVTGRITNALGEGVGTLSIQAFDDQGRLISSTALSQSGTGTTAGSYRLLIDPALARSGTPAVRSLSGPARKDPTLPVLEASLGLPLPNSQSRVDFAIPSYRKPVIYQLPIRGAKRRATPWQARACRPGAARRRLDDEAWRQAYYTATGDSDARGLVRLTLVPAPIGGSNLLYQVTIVSPPQTPYASVYRQEIQVRTE